MEKGEETGTKGKSIILKYDWQGSLHREGENYRKI